MEHGEKYHRAERKLSRVAACLSIHSKYKFTQLTQFERTSRDRIFFQFMEVRRSSFIVVGSSIKVPTKFASRVTILSFFPSISLLLGSSFSRRGRENRPGPTTGGKPVRFYSFFPLSCFLTFPSSVGLPSFFLSYLTFSVIARFYPSPRIPILFSLHLYASAIITGEPAVQIFNLVWQMADLEARGTFARRDKRKKRSFRMCPIAASRGNFPPDKPTLFARTEPPPRAFIFICLIFFSAVARFPPNAFDVVSIVYSPLPVLARICAEKRDL